MGDFGSYANIYQHIPFSTCFSINLGVNNIADIAYQNHLSRLKYTDVNAVTGRTGVFNMGRNLSLKINVPLEFTIK